MSYLTSKQEYVDAKDRTWTETALAADANGTSLELGRNRSCTATLAVTSVSASDSLDVKFQGSQDGSTWFDIVAFTQATGATTERKTFVGARFIRPVFDVTGASVAIAFTLTLEAV